jgi:tetratricopeptide (TPR) repeat protein
MNLDKAEKYIRKALDLDRKQRKEAKITPDQDKDNGAYLDSLGWVLYKEKKYKEAKEAMLEAVKDKDAQHIEIFDHLGDVHMALGEKADAVAAWKKGVDVAGDTKKEQERKTAVEKKLKEADGK